MKKRFSRKSVLAKLLIPGALLAVVVPEIAYADTASVTVMTPGPTMGPATPFTGVSSQADCGQGLVSGGGVNQATGSDRAGNGNHVMGIAPSADGVTEYTDATGVVGTDAKHWLAFGGSGSNSSPEFSTTPYAVCLSSNRIKHTQVVMNKAAGPSVGQTAKTVVATCPTGTVLLGGGARTTPASVGSLKPIASFPTFNDAAHDFGQKAAADGEGNPDSWTAVGGIGGGRDSDNTTYAYAICSGADVNVRGITTTVRFRELSGPTTAGTSQTATVGCAEGPGTATAPGSITCSSAGRGRQRRQRDDDRLHQGGVGRNPPRRELPQRRGRHPGQRRDRRGRVLDGRHPRRGFPLAEHLLRRLGALPEPGPRRRRMSTPTMNDHADAE
ncbi:hypothetical protein O1L55_23325 [Streptomyces albulus]|nr:hypothetical protein [Streptomyces noursei]